MPQLEQNSKLAVATSIERVQKMRLDSNLKLFCFDYPNNIYEYPLTILMKKDFPLLEELNTFIQYASDGGLIVKWLKGNRYSSVSEKPPNFNFSEGNFNSHWFNGIIFCSVTLLSLAVFFVEILIHRNIQGNKSSIFWRYCQMIIDPYRYFLLKDLSY